MLLEKLVSGMLPFALLVLCGVYITFKGSFFQFRLFNKSIFLTIKAFLNKKPASKKGVSSFQSACTALSATVGTGNIAGVAGAISLGGAGAVFWMWISALLGMAIKFAEISLSIKYRKETAYGFNGGPMYYIKNGLSKKYKSLAYIFSIAGIPAVFCTGNITQTNSAISSMDSGFVVKLIAGTVFAFITFLVVTGGAQRIGAVTEKIVPVMSVVYTMLCLGVIILNIDFLPNAFKMILIGAFTPKSVTGGAVGSIITVAVTGAARGIFSNEAGLGTSAMAHSKAYDASSETQGLFGIVEVFVDTIFICSITALTILCSRVNIDYGNISSTELVVSAFSVCYGKASAYLLSIMMCVFALSSVIGWALYGDVCISFLLGKKAKKLFLIIYPFICIIGAVLNARFAWRISEFFNGIMLCVNLPVLLLLSDDFLMYVKRGTKNDKEKNRKLKVCSKGRSSRTDYKY